MANQGTFVIVAINLPVEHTPRQQWRSFYCLSREGNTQGSHVWPMPQDTRISLFLMGQQLTSTKQLCKLSARNAKK